MRQEEIITTFVDGAKYYMVVYEHKSNEDFGKIIDGSELQKIDLNTNEIYRSIECKNDDVLFVFDMKPQEGDVISNPLQMLLSNLEGARLIEMVYPDIFTWAFDGLSLKAYAIVPSGDVTAHSTITRYGGTMLFIKILRQHLDNISKMRRGATPDYEFLTSKIDVKDTELAVGSINKFTNLYSIFVDLKSSYINIMKSSKNNVQTPKQLNILNMKYWTKEINPDFVVEAKHINLDETISIEEARKLYPPCIIDIMNLQYKGNFNRFKLARFLLSLHKNHDAKFLYHTILGTEELEHLNNGNDKGQWRYILNNMKRYNCPSCRELCDFCHSDCTLSHPLESAQEYLNIKNKKDDEEMKPVGE